MKTFNLVKSLSTLVNNITSLHFREGLGLGSLRLLILCLSLATFGVNEVWGAFASHWYYGYAYAWPNTSSSGTSLAGGVYVSLNGNTASKDSDYKPYDSSSKENTSVVTKTKGTWMAKAYDGYYFVGWYKDSYSGSALGSNTKYEKNDNGDWTVHAYAKFAPVTISQASSPSSLSFNEPGENTLTITFDVVGADMTNDFDYSVSGEGWSFNAWSYANNKVTMIVKYTASANTTNGTHSGTVTLTSKGTNNGLSSGTKSIKSVNVSADVNLTPTFNVSTDEYDFGDATLNVDTKTVSLNLTNIKNALSWDLSGLSIPFSASKNENVVTVTFKPVTGVEVKSYSQTLTIKATSGNGQTKSVNIAIIGNVISIKDPTFTSQLVNEYYVGDSDLDLSTLWTSDNKSGTISYSIISFIPTSGEQSGSVAPAVTSNRYLSLNKAGTLQLKMSQSATTSFYAHEETKTITISRIANTLTADATHSMKVDETWNGVISGKNSDGTITTSSTDATIVYYDVANNKIVAPNSSAKSFNSTEITITISQAETYKYTAVEETIKVTVKKHVPTFTWSNATLYHNQTYNDFFSTNGTNALTVKSSSDDNVAYLIDGSNAQKLNLKTLTKAASTTLTVTQAENYYWAEHTEQKTITPGYQSNHVPVTINSSTTYNIYNPAHGGAGKAYWSDGNGGEIYFEQGGAGFNWDDNYVDLSFTGIPDKLTYNTRLGGANTDVHFYIKEYVNGAWSDEKGGKNGASTETIQLSPNATKIRLCYSGNLNATFQNVKITELKTFSTSTDEIDFGNTNKIDMPCNPQTFTFNYANVGHKVTLTPSDSHFTVSPTSITNIGGEKYGSQTITVSYSTAEVHSATDAKLTIKDELGNTKEVTLKGTTTKKAQTLKWEKPYDVEEPAIPIGKTITGVATASSNLEVIYESSDETIIEIVNDGKAFKALTTGSATITAKQVGTEDWEEASISKTFKGTNKIIQVISWNQNFTRLLTNYGTQSLTAIVNLENAETGEQAYSKERSDLITYTSQNTSVVSVNGSTLTIVGKGETTLTATVPGDDLYESATVTIPVKVREPSAGCEDEMLGNDFGSGEYEFFHYSLTSDMEKVVKIDHSTPAIPGMLSFQHKGKKWGLNYSGEIVVYESTNNGSSWNKLGEVTPSEGTYNTQTYPLSRNATHIRFFRDKSATGYHYIKNVEISPAQFIESNAVNNTIDFGNVTVNSKEERTVTLSYANVKDALAITKSSDNLTLSCGDIIDLDCGATGTNTFTISFIPTAVGDFSDEILFYDKNSSKNYTLNIKAKVVRSTQHITWEPTQTEYRTIDQIELNATTSSSYPVKYYVKDGTDVADFVNGVLTIKKDGQITIRAYEPGDAIYEAAVDVDKTFTIRKTNLHFDPLPTAATITYPQTLSESALTDGVVKDEDGNVVAGTIAWANPATQLNAGENQSQGITFTPAANPAWYNALSSSVSVTVQKKESDAHAHAGEIIYGAAVESSVLTNEGTTEGIWTWTDEKKDQVLEVGTHEGLNVHFTPTDKTNYNEIDGTVSLTVKKAAATLTWTTASESADVKDKLTYTATSNHSESAIIYAITSGADCATIDASTGALTITKAGTITVQASQDASTHYEAATAITVTTTLTGEFENVFSGDGNWDNPENWTYGVPTSDNPDIVINGNMTISKSVNVGSLTIEAGGSVTIVVEGDLTVNGTSKDRDTYGNLFVRNGGDVTISENANVKVFDFVVESSIGTQNGTSVSGQVKHSNRVLYTNGAYIDINMDPKGKMDDTQWYAFTVPFPVDVQSGIARKEGDTFRKCTYGVEYMICEYDINQRLNTGKGWKYIKSGKLQPGRFYYFTVNGDYNVYSFKAAENTITINNTTELKVNGEGADANWNAVGNSTLTYTTISGEKVPAYVQTYVNGESRYITVATDDAQFVVGCPFFFQASEEATMILNEANGTVDAHYAPRQESVDKPVCVRVAEEGKHFSDQIYLTASQEATSEYTLGRDLAKAGIGTKSAQLWMNAYGQKLSVQDATLMGDQAYYELSIYAPKAGSYELSLPKVPANAVIYLTQNGYPIWNLNETPYVIECYKGTTNEFGLLLRLQEGGSPTDMQTMRGSEKVQKIMKDQRIYINANTQLYDLMGQKVK